VINNSSASIRATLHGGLVFTRAGYAVSAPTAFPLASSSPSIGGSVSSDTEGTTPFQLLLDGSPWNTMADLVTAATDAINTAGLGASLQASESGADGGTGTGSLKLTAVAVGASSSVVIAGGAFGSLAAAIHMGLANGGREIPGSAEHRPQVVDKVALATSGADGQRGDAGKLVGSDSGKTGIYALRDVDLFNILSIPETRDLPETDSMGVLIPAAVALCEERRAFYIIDPPVGRTYDDIVAWVQTFSPRSRNAATYFPAVRIVDPLDAFRPRAMAPSGTLAGVYARTDATRGVWKAPAGTDATLNGVLDLAAIVTDRENGTLNPQAVNALRSFPAYGRVAWGARTLKGSDDQADEYKYIPIRRLALFLEESLYRGTQWVVFEPNDEPLWAQIRLNVGAFMNGLFRQGAFQGVTPQEAYFVKCDKETTTQADRNLGIVNIVVGFAPLKPAEFVVISIQQIAGDLQ
jgi:uncharacterized protein